MRIAIALAFLAAVLACVFASKIAFAGYETMHMGEISDPQNLAVKFRETLYGQAAGTALASLALLLMTANAFMQQAKIKGIVIGLVALVAGTIAALAFLDVGSIADAAQLAKPPASEAPSPGQLPPMVTLFGRMSLRELSPGGIGFNLEMAHMRALTCLCLLGIGASLTLFHGAARRVVGTR